MSTPPEFSLVVTLADAAHGRVLSVEADAEARAQIAKRLALVALALIAAAGFWVYERSFAQGASSLRAASNGRLDLFASVVEARVRRLEPVPATIQLNPVVVRLLQAPSAAHALAANDYLSRLNAHLGSVAVYVLDVRGIVLASSNVSERDDSLRKIAKTAAHLSDLIADVVDYHLVAKSTVRPEVVDLQSLVVLTTQSVFTDLAPDAGEAVPSNQFLIVHGETGAIIDPGGDLDVLLAEVPVDYTAQAEAPRSRALPAACGGRAGWNTPRAPAGR